MGPFIARPVNRSSEVQRIVNMLQDEDLAWQIEDRLHTGRFVRVVYRQYSHIECTTCGWRSEGPVLDMDERGYEQIRTMHRDQWRLHRAERAVDEGVDI